jgi:hypothetical protein
MVGQGTVLRTFLLMEDGSLQSRIFRMAQRDLQFALEKGRRRRMI